MPERFKTFGDVALQAHLAHNYPADHGARTGSVRLLRSEELGLSVRHAHRGRRSGCRDRPRHAAALYRRGRLRSRHQPADRRRPGARRRGARHGSGAASRMRPTTIRRSSRADRSSNTRCRARTICPRSKLGSTVTPSPHNPLGVKGIGEAGTIASTAAVANAVVDALRAVRHHASRHAVHRRKGVARDARRRRAAAQA